MEERDAKKRDGREKIRRANKISGKEEKQGECNRVVGPRGLFCLLFLRKDFSRRGVRF